VGATNRASNRTQDARDRIKEAVDRIMGNRNLRNDGITEQARAEMKQNLEDAGYKVSDALTSSRVLRGS
jgi:uncharacterized protein YjbJ (UPF0337 family)